MKMKSSLFVAFFLSGCVLGMNSTASAQAVNVTMTLDRNIIKVGESTTLRVLAQVVPSVRTNADRIFSWYLDVLNTNGLVAVAGYDTMQKTNCDQHPLTSSAGVPDGFHRRGIYDTFLNLLGAGVTNPVELMTIPIQGVAPGRSAFRVQAGTGVPGLSHDFVVATTGGGDPLFGGGYTAAEVALTVAPITQLSIAVTPIAGGRTNRVVLNFSTQSGLNYRVQAADGVGLTNVWQTLPGSPHNSGTVTLTNSASRQFYRVAVGP